jgi:hypothetical protein
VTRDEKGRFVNGNKASPGRKPKATEAEYLDAFKSVIPLERFVKQIEAQAKRADRGDLMAFGAIAKFLGLDVQKIQQENHGEITVKIIYEHSLSDKTS